MSGAPGTIRSRPHERRTVLIGFTLIELLVVIAIIALLLGILLPAMSKAREVSTLTVCGANMRQIGVGIAAYSSEFSVIPAGPNVSAMATVLEANDGTLATSQIWTGPQVPMQQTMGLGLLIDQAKFPATSFYCPGDDTNDPVKELANVRGKTLSPAFSSYLYRQLDQTDGRGRLGNLGLNDLGFAATAMALDMNSKIDVVPEYYRTNHEAEKVNVLYSDGSVIGLPNLDDTFTLRNQDLMTTPARRDEILQNADQPARFR